MNALLKHSIIEDIYFKNNDVLDFVNVIPCNTNSYTPVRQTFTEISNS